MKLVELKEMMWTYMMSMGATEITDFNQKSLSQEVRSRVCQFSTNRRFDAE